MNPGTCIIIEETAKGQRYERHESTTIGRIIALVLNTTRNGPHIGLQWVGTSQPRTDRPYALTFTRTRAGFRSRLRPC